MPNNHKCINIDVTSLYMNVPIELAMNLQNLKKEWSELKRHITLDLQILLEATKLCLDSTYFCYNN